MSQYRWNTASWCHFSLRVSCVLHHLWRTTEWGFDFWFGFLFPSFYFFFPSALPRKYQRDVLGVEVAPFLVGVSATAKLGSVNTSKEHTAQYCVYYLLVLF